MKFKTLILGGGYSADISTPGGNVQGEVILGEMPGQPAQAAPKRYVDEQLTSLKATHATKGTLPYSVAQQSVNLRSSGFQVDAYGVFTTQYAFGEPGEYCRISVNDKGQVTAGHALTPSNVPSFSWSKIASEKPTTAAGYGITDALTAAGGNLQANLTLAANPSADHHAATRLYANAAATAHSLAFKSGDLVLRPVAATYAGWLRCNGADVSNTAYPALYAKIGDAFNQVGTPAGYFRLPTLSVTSTLFVYIRT